MNCTNILRPRVRYGGKCCHATIEHITTVACAWEDGTKLYTVRAIT